MFTETRPSRHMLPARRGGLTGSDHRAGGCLQLQEPPHRAGGTRLRSDKRRSEVTLHLRKQLVIEANPPIGPGRREVHAVMRLDAK